MTKRIGALPLFVLLVGLSFVTAAQPCPAGVRCAGGRGGDGLGPGAWHRMYDPKTVETIAGNITSIERIPGPNGNVGVHAMLKSDKGEDVTVLLGPAWYLEQQSVTVKQGDRVSVRGSHITFRDKPAIIAAEVTKEGQTLRLRNGNGRPAWAGRRRQGG